MRLRILALVLLGSSAWAACTQPVISSPAASFDSTCTVATITWTTDRAADSWVCANTNGCATMYPASPQDGVSGVTSHSVTGIPVSPGLQFDWGIRTQAIDGGVACGYHYYAFFGGGDTGNHSTPCSAPAGSFDYSLGVVGPQHVTQGYGLHLLITGPVLQGAYTNNGLSIVATGLPTNTAGRWPSTQDFKVGADAVSTTTVTGDTIKMFSFSNTSQQEFELLTNQGGTTPCGTYALTFTASGTGMPTHAVNWPITVDCSSAPFNISAALFSPNNAPRYYPPIPNLDKWMNNMVVNGAFNCAEDEDCPTCAFVNTRTIRANDNANLCAVGGSIQKCSWYYDGVRVYYNISSMLQQHDKWQQCRDNVNAIYRDTYLANNNGAVQTYTIFPEGLYMDYQDLGTAADLTQIDNLELHTFNPANGTMIPVRLDQRETAYDLKVDHFESKLGRSQTVDNVNTAFLNAYHLDLVLGHLDQICLSQNPQYFEYFMAGLEADALITYYEDGNYDPRIPSAIKCLADYIWANGWNTIDTDHGTFPYDYWRFKTDENPSNASASSSVELNLLIAPMYAWLFRKTGLQQYQIEGDLIWQYGAAGVGADGQGGGLSQQGANNGPTAGNAGKEFSENNYWAWKYVKWRSPDYFFWRDTQGHIARRINALSPVLSPVPHAPAAAIMAQLQTVSHHGGI